MSSLIARNTQRIAFTARTAASCLGRGREAHLTALRDGRSGLAPCDFPGVDFPCFIGRVAGIEDDPFPANLAEFDNRASRLALAALRVDGFEDAVVRARERFGPRRIGVILGTSTSGVERSERAYRDRPGRTGSLGDYSVRHHNDHQAVAAFVQEHLGLDGISYTVSTACSSSAKAILDGVQMIEAGFCDAVVAGGADSLCLTSLYGFEALELVSREPSRPCDAGRDGLSIGEGAAFVLIERDAPTDVPRLAGYGESSDGVHMSTPPKDGAGAALAMAAALDRAGLAPEAIDFVNLHGTATPTNDIAESIAVAGVVGTSVPVASFKGAVGHTLGAAGGLEAVLCLYAMEAGIAPANAGLQRLDPAIRCRVLAATEPSPMRHVMTNAFGFGGSNCTLILSAGG